MQYKRFSDFAEEPELLNGSKLKIEEILNKEILIVGYKIGDSKFHKSNSSKCLTLQFELDDEKHVIFTGSNVLINQIERYKKEIPFLATIKKIDKYFSFT
ncbi:MAG: hypothetical protein H8D67_18950 [Deltaproteobacteria bacterium]|nr:hypothetical protein [Deltaproteobacteria bacterium]